MGGYALRTLHLTLCAASASAPFVFLGHELDEGDGSAVRVRGARLARTADALRVPPARARLRRGARRPRSPSATTPRSRVDDLRREPAARDLRARARRPIRRRGAARSSAACSCRCCAHRRELRRLRLGRQRVRPRVRRARALALRRGARVRAPSRRSSASPRDADRARRRDPRPRRRRPASSPRTGRRPAGLLPRDFGRETDRLLRARARAVARAGHRRGARRAGRARRRRHRAPPRHRGPGRRRPRPLRAARLAPVRDPPGAADRRDRAARRADAARPVPCDRRRASCVRASRSPTTTRSSARRSTAGSSSLFQGDPFRAEQLREALERAARRRPGRCGRPVLLRALRSRRNARDRTRAASARRGRAGVGALPTDDRAPLARRARCSHGDRRRRSSRDAATPSLLGLRPAGRLRAARCELIARVA